MYAFREILAQVQVARTAIGHFNIADLVLLKAVFASARELKVPVLVGASEGEREFIGTRQLAALVRSLREECHIKAAARVLLTLHGGSGTDDDDLRQAIAAGINIVHINTELRVAWRRGLEDGLAKQPGEVVPYRILPAAVDAVKTVTGSRLKLFSEGGRLAFPG